MNSQKGITLTSLTIYITILLIVVGILTVIFGTFQSNIGEIYSEGTNNVEIDKFNIYFLREVKRQGNEISAISENEIEFTTENKYTYNNNEQCIYLNDSIKIAENIEKCIFDDTDLDNGKTVITVLIKTVNGEEKTVDYVLSNKNMNNSYENEIDYTFENIVANEISQ